MECNHVITPLIFLPCEALGVEVNSYAQMPTPVQNGDLVRIFFSSRNNQSQSRIYFADLNIENHFSIDNHGEVGLQLGLPGTFDDNGIMPSSIQKIDDAWYLYYIGWNRSVQVPYHTSVGLAVSRGGLDNFEKYSIGPIIDRSPDNPFFVTTPGVQYANKKHQMYLSRGYEWEMHEGVKESKYLVSSAESLDGISWQNYKQISLDCDANSSIARPIAVGNHLIYSQRPISNFRNVGMGYRLEISKLHEKFIYKKCEITWDSSYQIENDVAYAHPLQIGEILYLFFNGNHFGKDGIYIAEIEGSFEC